MTRRHLSLPLAGLLAAAALGASNLSDADKERFLSEAEIVATEQLGVGVTHSRKLTLTDGIVTHHAHFQNIDEYPKFSTGRATGEVNFRDSYRYNIAAYRLDRMLGLGMIPVSIKRRHAGHKGALTWWVDETRMMESDRRRDKIEPPDRHAWVHQTAQARLLQELVHNTDTNTGNMLIDAGWNLWLVDFTRSFRLTGKLRRPELLIHVDRRVWEALLNLDEQSVHERMDGVLLNAEIKALLKRRAGIVSAIQERIARQGESAVLCDAGGR